MLSTPWILLQLTLLLNSALFPFWYRYGSPGNFLINVLQTTPSQRLILNLSVLRLIPVHLTHGSTLLNRSISSCVNKQTDVRICYFQPVCIVWLFVPPYLFIHCKPMRISMESQVSEGCSINKTFKNSPDCKSIWLNELYFDTTLHLLYHWLLLNKLLFSTWCSLVILFLISPIPLTILFHS